MYADRPLNALATRKALLQARIELRRLECVMHGTRIAAPVALVDALWAQWKGISQATASASDGEGGDATSQGSGKMAKWLALLPVAMQAWQAFRAQRAAAEARADSGL